METFQAVVAALAPVVIPLIIAGLTALGGLLGRWLHSKTGESKLLAALASGADYVGTAVSHIMAGLEPEIKKALADDGKISPAELDEIKRKVLALIKAEMPAALKTVADALGPAFETWLSGKVSQAVNAELPSDPPRP